MKKIKLAVLALSAMIIFSATAQAAVGVIDFKKVGASYNYAKVAYKDLDNKSLELQQFMIEKEKQYKAIESPIARKNFEEKTQKEFALKREAYEKMLIAKDEEIYNKIIAATKAVSNTKRLDMVLDQNAVFVGGIDISADVIKYLNGGSTTTAP